MQITGDFGKVTVFDIYNDCQDLVTVNLLGMYLATQPGGGRSNSPDYSLWCGNFNCHHPMWEGAHNHHLFTAASMSEFVKLLELVVDHGIEMMLPGDIPTLEVMATKNWMWPDNVFSSSNLADKVVYCTTEPHLWGPGTDHVPILTVIELPIEQVQVAPSYNFREAEWDDFRDELEARLADIPSPAVLSTEGDFSEVVKSLTGIIQDTIQTTVPQTQPCPNSKRTRGGGVRN